MKFFAQIAVTTAASSLLIACQTLPPPVTVPITVTVERTGDGLLLSQWDEGVDSRASVLTFYTLPTEPVEVEYRIVGFNDYSHSKAGWSKVSIGVHARCLSTNAVVASSAVMSGSDNGPVAVLQGVCAEPYTIRFMLKSPANLPSNVELVSLSDE